MLKLMVGAVAVAGILGYAWMGRNGANEYPLAPQATYDKLMRADFKKGGKEPWGTVGAEKSGNGSNRITFTGWGECTLDILPDGAARSALTVSCPNMGEGAAAGMETSLRRGELIEWIDATMTDRPFNSQRGLLGTTAGMWPDDVVKHGGLLDAQAEALKMSSEAARDASPSASNDDDDDKAGLGYHPSSTGRGNGAGVDQSRNYGTDPANRY